jgi:hypothetical protein
MIVRNGKACSRGRYPDEWRGGQSLPADNLYLQHTGIDAFFECRGVPKFSLLPNLAKSTNLGGKSASIEILASPSPSQSYKAYSIHKML